MTQILLNALKTDFGVPGEEAATVNIVATPWAGAGPKIRVSGQKLILPDSDALTFTGTTASENFELAAPDGAYCWKLDVSSQSPAVAFTRFVVFDEVPTIDWADLTDVNPSDFSQTANPEPAWWLEVDLLYMAVPQTTPGAALGTGGDIELHGNSGSVRFYTGLDPAASGDVLLGTFSFDSNVQMNLVPTDKQSRKLLNSSWILTGDYGWEVWADVTEAPLVASSTYSFRLMTQARKSIAS